MTRRGRQSFERFIGIDYSGAAKPETPLAGLRMYESTRDGPPVEVRPFPGRRTHWSRRGLFAWLAERLAEGTPALVGIDHGFSFPVAYFDRHGLAHDWGAFLADFRRHWPTDESGLRVADLRPGSRRTGEATWRRLCDRRAGGAKSVFHFGVPGAVASSTHAGLPWLARLREARGGAVHVWPFDGWSPPTGRSVVAEVYPALWSRAFPRRGRTPDQHDAWSVSQRLRHAARAGELAAWFEPDLDPADRRRAGVEGWILGVPS